MDGLAVDLMDNALRCPQPHSFSRRIVQLIELKDREERRRLSWIVAYRERPDAGAVCRRFGISRPTLRKWLRRYEADGEIGLCALSRRPHHFPAQKVDEALQAAILDLRRARRLGAKRLRNELQRLHGVRLSAATVHKVLVQHGLSVLPTRKRSRHRPKRYNRPVPGDRVQMDTCKIRPSLYQFTAIDDCSRFLSPA
jgi:transposase